MLAKVQKFGSLVFCALSLFISSFGVSKEYKEPILPIPRYSSDVPEEKLLLGKDLFHEKALSKDDSVSCASCHDLRAGGDDGRTKSIGIKGAIGGINAPTVFNSSLNFRQFWNGRAANLAEQIEGPIHHPKEMGSHWEEIVKKLQAKASYQEKFSKVYKDGINKKNIKDAIVSFEQALLTPDSRFDLFLKGNKDVLSQVERRGYQKFKSYGCIACHQGMNVGGNMYQSMGVMGNYFKKRQAPITEEDLGRYSLTKKETDKFVFRVPSLRNVELTAPYFHDGSIKTLEAAVEVMAKYQLGVKIPKEDVDQITTFLKTLTGKTPEILLPEKKWK